MLCFVFSALAVVLDQLFKHWAVITLAVDGDIVLIPGIIGLTYAENTGAAFGMFSNMRWILAGIALACAIILALILLRYNGGFWSRLGLAAVLGGTVGNLLDRVFRSGGVVVDMFEFKFVNFAIFNIADMFLTLGGITFCVFYLIASAKESRAEKEKQSAAESGGTAAQSHDVPRVLPKPERGAAPQGTRQPGQRTASGTQKPVPGQDALRNASPRRMPEPDFAKKTQKHVPGQDEIRDLQKLVKPEGGDYQDYLKGLSAASILEEFDLDKIMSEYGLDEKKD